MQGGKNWIFLKEMNANRFFWDSHWLEIWSNHFSPSMGPNGGSVAMDSVRSCGDPVAESGLLRYSAAPLGRTAMGELERPAKVFCSSSRKGGDGRIGAAC